jgi:hypothetical protein
MFIKGLPGWWIYYGELLGFLKSDSLASFCKTPSAVLFINE